MAEANVNPWFGSAERPMTTVAQILEALDRKGHLDDEMREALKKHAQNQAEVLPSQIVACASVAALAAAQGAGGYEVSQALWSIAAQGESLIGMGLIHEVFSEPRRTMKAA